MSSHLVCFNNAILVLIIIIIFKLIAVLYSKNHYIQYVHYFLKKYTLFTMRCIYEEPSFSEDFVLCSA